MTYVNWKLMHGGACTHPEKMVIPTGTWQKRTFPALFSLIEHPKHGPILIDTGYAKHFFDETHKMPYRIMRYLTPVQFDERQSAYAQVIASGYQPEAVQFILLTHLHPDHVAGLKDFPKAAFYLSRTEYQSIADKKGIAAIRKGFIPGLLPIDFAKRSHFIEENANMIQDESIAPFEKGYDVFHDGSIVAVEIPGHSDGQIGFFIRTSSTKRIFLAADSCWVSEAYQNLIYPHPITHVLNKKAPYRNSLFKVHQLSQMQPKITIVPSHCQTYWKNTQTVR
ncbi:MBL fold metallo-hydrolase [Hazenella sp. IB182357]|uniref:MBL fold metallo-hydrolase n=1 Tax=Polycladospora coralii TaxID=2771432 RepID=A0A926RWF1_9BACL|nr:MBL fold metallo-hydrolase [Polycladospora coralii]MBD1371446.1 MBL fold metallo-hydrolase [Polycladospora coralii]